MPFNSAKAGIDDEMIEFMMVLQPTVEHIELPFNSITAKGVALIAEHFTSLKVLGLEDNEIGDEGLKEISKIASLTELNISSTFEMQTTAKQRTWELATSLLH